MKKALLFCIGFFCCASAHAAIDTVFTLPGGSTTTVQYNDNRRFGGDADFTFNENTNTLAITSVTATNVRASSMTVSGPVTAGSFSGNGSGLTNLSSASLTGYFASFGDVAAPTAAISSALTSSLLTISNTNYVNLSASTQTKNGGLTLNGTLTATALVGDGSGITNIGTFATLGGTQTFTGQNTFGQITVNSTAAFNSALNIFPDPKSSSVTITTQTVIDFNPGAAITTTLPAATGTGKFLFFKNSSTNTITLAPNGSDLIDSTSSLKMCSKYDSVVIQDISTGNWGVFSNNIKVYAKYNTTAGQTIANNSTTVIDFGTKDIDTHAAVVVGAAWKFTVPITGIYQVSSNIVMGAAAGWEAGEVVRLIVTKNGAAVGFSEVYATASHGARIGSAISHGFSFQTGDIVGISVYQDNDGSVDIITDADADFVTITMVK